MAEGPNRRSLPALGAAFRWPRRSKPGFGFSQIGRRLPPLAFISRKGNVRSRVPVQFSPKRRERCLWPKAQTCRRRRFWALFSIRKMSAAEITAGAGRRTWASRLRLGRVRPGEAEGVSPGLSGKAKAAVPVFRSPVPRSEGRLREGRSLSGDAAPAEAPERRSPDLSRPKRRTFPERSPVRAQTEALRNRTRQREIPESRRQAKSVGGAGFGAPGPGASVLLVSGERAAAPGNCNQWQTRPPIPAGTDGIARESLALALALPRDGDCLPVFVPRIDLILQAPFFLPMLKG